MTTNRGRTREYRSLLAGLVLGVLITMLASATFAPQEEAMALRMIGRDCPIPPGPVPLDGPTEELTDFPWIEMYTVHGVGDEVQGQVKITPRNSRYKLSFKHGEVLLAENTEYTVTVVDNMGYGYPRKVVIEPDPVNLAAQPHQYESSGTRSRGPTGRGRYEERGVAFERITEDTMTHGLEEAVFYIRKGGLSEEFTLTLDRP